MHKINGYMNDKQFEIKDNDSTNLFTAVLFHLFTAVNRIDISTAFDFSVIITIAAYCVNI